MSSDELMVMSRCVDRMMGCVNSVCYTDHMTHQHIGIDIDRPTCEANNASPCSRPLTSSQLGITASRNSSTMSFMQLKELLRVSRGHWYWGMMLREDDMRLVLLLLVVVLLPPPGPALPLLM
jgi:hypothetical protein